MKETIFDSMIDRINKVDKDLDVISRLAATNEIIGFALDVELNNRVEEYGDPISN